MREYSFIQSRSLLSAVAALALLVPAESSRANDGERERPFMPFSRQLSKTYQQRETSKRWSHRRNNNGFSKQFPSEYRTADGDGNNRTAPDWGAAEVPFLRSIEPAYQDGYLEPVEGLASARQISERLCAQDDPIANELRATDYVWQWGQFLDHDLTETPLADPAESFPIVVPAGDPWFDPYGTGSQLIGMSRSAYVNDVHGVRHQVNAITAFIDASNVYGSDDERAHALRTNDGTGKLKSSDSAHGPLLPYNVEGFPNAGGNGASLFFAGDVRANEQAGLTAMHTLFLREHNYWADRIHRQDSRLNGEEIYQMARVIVGAEMQAITYREFLPVLLGRGAIPRYQGYREEVNPGISNLFASSAYRFGHSMLSENLLRIEANGESADVGQLPLAQAFFNPTILPETGIDTLLRGLGSQQAQRVDTRIVSDVRNFLFGPPGAGGFDLAALNIQRGRDHGLPDFSTVRGAFGLSPLDGFDDMNTIDLWMSGDFEDLYESPDKIDAWTGFLSEAHVDGALVGETLQAVLVDQFARLRDGDRFWYQSYLRPSLRTLVEKQTLAVIIRRNTGIGHELQDNVFLMKPEPRPRQKPRPRWQSQQHTFSTSSSQNSHSSSSTSSAFAPFGSSSSSTSSASNYSTYAILKTMVVQQISRWASSLSRNGRRR